MGDDGEFSEYVAARWSTLVRAAVLLGCQPAEAEDLVQTSLERCLRKWHHVQGAEDRDAYVHRILLNTYSSGRRRHWRRETPTTSVPDRAVTVDTDLVDDADAVVRALRNLTPDQRTAVVLRYYVNLSEQQMATALAVPPGTVKSRLARALTKLAREPHLEALRGTQ